MLVGVDLEGRVALVQFVGKSGLTRRGLADYERDGGSDRFLHLEEHVGVAAVGVDVAVAAFHLLLIADYLFIFSVQF